MISMLYIKKQNKTQHKINENSPFLLNKTYIIFIFTASRRKKMSLISSTNISQTNTLKTYTVSAILYCPQTQNFCQLIVTKQDVM